MAHGNSVRPSRAHSKLKCWTAEPEPATFLETETMDPTAHVGVDHPVSAAAAVSGAAGRSEGGGAGAGAAAAMTVSPDAALGDAAEADAMLTRPLRLLPATPAVGVAATAEAETGAAASRGRFSPALATWAALAASISARRASTSAFAACLAMSGSWMMRTVSAARAVKLTSGRDCSPDVESTSRLERMRCAARARRVKRSSKTSLTFSGVR